MRKPRHGVPLPRGGFIQGAVLLAVLWQLLSFALGARIIPAPATVLLLFVKLAPEVLWRHSLASLARVLASLAAASLVAVPAGLLLGRSRRADRLFSPLAYLLYPVPKIALLPPVFLVLGMGEIAKIVVVGMVLFFQILVAVRDGARNVEPQYLDSIRSLGAGRLQTLRYVIIPAIVPELLTSLRIGTGTALAVLFFAETFFTRYGLGFFIMDGWMRIDYPRMFTGILGIGILGFLLFRLIDRLEASMRRRGW